MAHSHGDDNDEDPDIRQLPFPRVMKPGAAGLLFSAGQS
jgi:hypothetical protein